MANGSSKVQFLKILFVIHWLRHGISNREHQNFLPFISNNCVQIQNLLILHKVLILSLTTGNSAQNIVTFIKLVIQNATCFLEGQKTS